VQETAKIPAKTAAVKRASAFFIRLFLLKMIIKKLLPLLKTTGTRALNTLLRYHPD
jgi:hypothetical protein